MGSFDEFSQAISFVEKHKITPLVHETYRGLEEADRAIEQLKSGEQFGKIVISIVTQTKSNL